MVPAAHAHNGAVAVALPLAGIVIDGDLQDWPASVPSYAVSRTEYGVAPMGPDDLSAHVRFAFDRQRSSLLVAFDVRDDHPMVNTRSDRGWDSEDGIEIYLDVGHGRSSTVRQFALRGEGNAQQRTVDLDAEVAVAWRREGTRQQYEWRIDLDPDLLSQMSSGRTISIDVVVCDYDPDGSFSWVAWGRRTGKVGPANRRGDVVLVADADNLGSVKGRALWDELGSGIAGAGVRIQAVNDSALWVGLASKSGGAFDVVVPAGPYVATVEVGPKPWIEIPIDVEPLSVRNVEFRVPSTEGTVRALGAGNPIRAGQGARRGAWWTLGVIDGVQGGIARSIVQDHNGYLWFGTQGGLHRYDGAQILHYKRSDGLLSQAITALILTKDGSLWIGSNAGLSRLQGDSLTNYTTQDGLIDNEIQALLEAEDGSLWVGTNGGLSHYVDGQFLNYTATDGLGNNTAWALAQDHDGIVWIGTRGGGLVRFDGESFQPFTTTDGLAGNDVRALHVADDGVLWIGSDGGLSRRDGDGFLSLTTADGLPFPAVQAMTTDRRGDLWISACESLYTPGDLFTCQPLRWTPDAGFETWTDLGNEYLYDLHADQEGNLWVSMTGGLARYDAGDFRTWSIADGLPNNQVRALHEDEKGRIWIGTAGGLSRLDGDSLRTWTTADGLAHDLVHDILQEPNGDLWIGTEGGVSRFQGDDLTAFTEQDLLPYNRIMQMSLSADGTLWMASMGGGIISHKDGAFSQIGVEEGLANSSVLSVRAHPSGGVWASIWDAGVTRLLDGSLRQFGVADGLMQRGVSAIHVDAQGDLWLASSGAGISRLQDQGVSHLPLAEGMVQDVVGITQGRDGSFWFSSSTGTSHYNGEAFQSLLKRDGLADDSVQEVIEDSDGNIWVATLGSGITRYRPVEAPPPIAITDVIGEQRYGPVAQARIPSTSSLLAFEFHGISFRTRPGAMQYRYRLLGHEPEWRLTSRPRVEFDNLPTGDYRFEVFAIDRDLVSSEEPATVDVQIRLPVEQITIWSILGLTLLALGWQGRQLLQRNRLRDRREREERALSAVRDTIWNLSSSSELDRIMPAIRQALEDAAVPFANSGINLVEGDEDEPRMVIAMFNDDGDLVTEKLEDDDNVALRLWQQQEVAYRRNLDEEDPFGERPFIRPPTCCVLDMPFSHGTLAVSSPTPSAFDAHLDYLQQLAGVLSEGFRRADDLRLLEERSSHLEREEHRQRTILETANEGFWRVDTSNVTVEINDAMCSILGRRRDEVLGTTLEGFLDEENLAILYAEIARRKEGISGAYEVSVLRPDGIQVPCRINATPLFDEEGKPLGSFAMVTDMSVIRERERREQLLATFREAVWALDSTSGVIDLLNPMRQLLEDSGIRFRAFGVNVVESVQEARVTAYTTGVDSFRGAELKPVHGRKVIELWQNGEVANRADLHREDAMHEREDWGEQGDSQTAFVPPTTRDGPRSVVDVPFTHGTLAANSAEPNAFTEHLGLLTDLASILSEGFQRLDDLQALRDRTDRAEAARQAAESANRSKSVFLANMSHEIRTPMNAILGFTEILQSAIKDPQHREFVASIQASGKSLLSLINDILDLSKVESGKLDLELRPADAHSVVYDLERLFRQRAESKGIGLKIEIDESFPAVLIIDEIRLRQILVNLVSNAVKFTDTGEVGVRAAAESTGDQQVTLRIEVTDSGIGIPADQHERIFGLFEQQEGQSINEYGGTGLGLAITRQLVTLMGGSIDLSSTPGEGTTFIVELPRVQVAAAAAADLARLEGVPVDDYEFDAATILLADDVPTNRELVKGFLSPFPFTFIEAENGEEAMEMVQRQEPDLVLMDIKMPVLDGFTASRRLKADEAVRRIPIVALTASVMRESEAEISQVCDGFLRKPVSREDLVLELARFLSHRIAQSESKAEEAVDAWDSGDLTPDQRARLPELLAALEATRATWEAVSATLTINEVEDFANEAQRLATEYGYSPLSDWAQRVVTQATTFDMDGMAGSMPEYLDLLEQLTAATGSTS
ncbi:MAG: response regulator [Gemmatimonadetes bacterium]|jgi:PAS domain S-box-containing protein|nr:response regulator [Gemmatimonadota bacterium]MBT5586943.1 response regulator [Gemmatimonadota bacterium]MBT5965394.1 response regulator [Gemmatimonadota bacterium]MBT6629315.1 response regulator [Gemmatimonadota bacterium]MBT7454934.1 response regulator [Gemmatimonadota bacterium]